MPKADEIKGENDKKRKLMSAYVDPELLKAVRIKAAENDQNISEFLRDLVVKSLNE